MPEIKAIVLDLDGTLLDTSKSISPRNYRAVKACHDAGLRVIVATARPPRAVRNFLKDAPFVDYTVFYNGALVTCELKKIQRHMSIPAEISQRIAKFVLSQEPESVISYEVNDLWYTSASVTDSHCVQLGIRPTDTKPEVVNQDFISSLSPTKILVLGFSQWVSISERFGDKVNVIATDDGVLVQIMHGLASKENGVRWVLDDIDLSPENVMVFGDDFNDLGLFHLCGFPVAMGNGINELKERAKFVTMSNDEDGVAVALEKFVL